MALTAECRKRKKQKQKQNKKLTKIKIKSSDIVLRVLVVSAEVAVNLANQIRCRVGSNERKEFQRTTGRHPFFFRVMETRSVPTTSVWGEVKITQYNVIQLKLRHQTDKKKQEDDCRWLLKFRSIFHNKKRSP
ncbi:hypothetical protein OUZ56_003001 [Daphnia magna]|uniref:Uncharacterized protein n=1 Tax=Daphnia magna TaxID=35525 RepID=A0ABR0A7W6_9CRUS|nr:hypothetical protein OUZ56_003001 [Daphnia magna]